MTWEEKLMALQSISPGEVALYLLAPGSWCVRVPYVNVKKGDLLGGHSVHGKTPQEAVEVTWEGYTNLEPGETVVVNAMSDSRREYRWNGYMWREVAK